MEDDRDREGGRDGGRATAWRALRRCFVRLSRMRGGGGNSRVV